MVLDDIGCMEVLVCVLLRDVVGLEARDSDTAIASHSLPGSPSGGQELRVSIYYERS